MTRVTIARAEASALWALRGRVLGGAGPEGHLHLKGDGAEDTRHWVASLDGEVVGCVTVMARRGWALRAMAVSPTHQRTGIGRQLLDRVGQDVDAPMWCNARLAAVPFYAACGWQVTSPPFVIDGAGLHRRMTWAPTDRG
jgi:N-acetylglutamate synthase and related acetyltransferases